MKHLTLQTLQKHGKFGRQKSYKNKTYYFTGEQKEKFTSQIQLCALQRPKMERSEAIFHVAGNGTFRSPCDQ